MSGAVSRRQDHPNKTDATRRGRAREKEAASREAVLGDLLGALRGRLLFRLTQAVGREGPVLNTKLKTRSRERGLERQRWRPPG